MRRFLLTFVTAVIVSSNVASAAPFKLFYSPAEKAAIKSMPIEQRPYRVGHIYGNTVRAVNKFQAWQQR